MPYEVEGHGKGRTVYQAKANLMTNVLYGAPYVSENKLMTTPGMLDHDVEIFNLKLYENVKKEFLTRIEAHLDKDGAKARLKEIDKLKKEIEKQTYLSLGLRVGSKKQLQQVLRTIYNKTELSKALLLWLEKVAKTAVKDAKENLSKSAYDKSLKRRSYMYNNVDKYFKAADDEFKNVSDILNEMGIPSSGSEEKLQKVVQEVLFGTRDNRLPTISMSKSNQRGPVGELTTGLTHILEDLLNDSVTDVLEELDKLVIFMGSEGGKGDIKQLKGGKTSISHPLVISVKNYEDIFNKALGIDNSSFSSSYENFTVNSGGNFTDFFAEFQKKIDPSLDLNDIIDQLNTYWLNVLYFRNDNFILTHSKMKKEFEDTRARLNAILNTYGAIFLITGYEENINKLKDIRRNVKNGQPALFFEIAGVGAIPYFEILNQIEVGMKMAADPAVKLTFHTPGAGTTTTIDKVGYNEENENKKGNDLNKYTKHIYTANGPYSGTIKSIVGNSNSIQNILEKRYEEWSSTVKTTIQLNIRGTNLKKLIDKYVI